MNYANSDTFYYNQLAQVIVLWQIKNLCVNVPFLLCILYLRTISKYKPSGALIWRGDLTECFFRYEFGGLRPWRGLYMEGLIFGVLRYLRELAGKTGKTKHVRKT